MPEASKPIEGLGLGIRFSRIWCRVGGEFESVYERLKKIIPLGSYDQTIQTLRLCLDIVPPLHSEDAGSGFYA